MPRIYFAIIRSTKGPKYWLDVPKKWTSCDVCWRVTVRSKIERKGRDATIRIPAALMSAAGLSMVRTVNVHGESGRIIIEKLPGSEYDLEQLVSRITPKNRHRE